MRWEPAVGPRWERMARRHEEEAGETLPPCVGAGDYTLIPEWASPRVIRLVLLVSWELDGDARRTFARLDGWRLP